MNKEIPLLLLLPFAALFVLANDSEEIDLDQFPTTPHGTSIIDNSDVALEGTWILVEAYAHTVQGKRPHPFAGHMLTINPDGTFLEDYSTAYSRNQSLRSQYEVSGKSGGKLMIELEADLDVWDDPDVLEGDKYIPHLVMQRDMSIGPKPEIKSRGMPVGNMVPQPLGAGRAYNIGDGEIWVHYDYEMEYDPNLDTWPKLKLSTMLARKVTWVFRRQGTPEFAAEVPLPASQTANLWGMAQLTGLPEQKAPQPNLAAGEFTIMVTRSGSAPAMIPVTEATTIAEVRTLVTAQLGLTGYEFDFRIAGKVLDESSTMEALGFRDPGSNFPGPVGNIIVRVKNP